MDRLPPFYAQNLESICKVLGDTVDGLTGSEISYILRDCKVADSSADATKWKRLFNALAEAQNSSRLGNHVIMFITRAMNPVLYSKDPTRYAHRLDRLNVVLAFSGYQVGSDGKVRRTDRASDLPAALQKASRLHSALVTRGVHDDVLRFCRPELLQENFFHAVLEAMKGVTAKVRKKSGLSEDGAALVGKAFGFDGSFTPLIAINSLASETERGEQRGFSNLLVGMYGMIRNPLAHDPKIEWPMGEQDALDILTLISMVHRKLDYSVGGQTL